MEKHRFQLLDVYRGVAALLVVLFHITGEMSAKFHYIFLGNFFNFGNIGVDFFFVLSGFIIFYIHHKDKPSGISTFFKKRAIRIYPSYIAIVVIILASFGLFGRFITSKPHITLPYLFATFTLFPHGFRIDPPSWTLTQELYFYFLFGFLLFIPNIKKRLGIFFSIALVFFLGSLLFQHLSQAKESTYIIQTAVTPYLFEFVGGCIAGYIFSYLRNKITKQQFLVISIVCAIAFILLLVIRGSFIYLPLITLVFGLFIWATGALEASYKLKIPYLIYLIGLSSYVIYLFHTFIVMVVIKISYLFWRIPTNGFLLFSIAIASFLLSILVSCIFYLVYEKPILKLLRQKFT